MAITSGLCDCGGGGLYRDSQEAPLAGQLKDFARSPASCLEATPRTISGAQQGMALAYMWVSKEASFPAEVAGMLESVTDKLAWHAPHAALPQGPVA